MFQNAFKDLSLNMYLNDKIELLYKIYFMQALFTKNFMHSLDSYEPFLRIYIYLKL